MGRKKSTQGKRNKQAGSQFERDFAQWIRDKFGFTKQQVATARSESKTLDARKVDIVDPTAYIHQCKVNSNKSFNVMKVLESMKELQKDGETPVVNIRQREKRGQRFYTVGHVSVMYTEDLLDILAELHEYRNSSNKENKSTNTE